MKIRGQKISGSNVEFCVIPRGNGENIVFRCVAVLDMSDFDRVCPAPKVPIRLLPNKEKIADVEDPLFKGLSELRDGKRIQYLILKSLEGTEDLEWETVNMSDSETWKNYETELRDSGFTHIEIMRIVNTCMTVNCLNEDKVEEARKAFLAGLAHPPVKPSSQNGEQQSIQSGVLASV